MKKHLTLALTLLTLICTSAHAQLPSYLPSDGLVGWWPFNGNANDESGNGNDGVVNGATLAEDRFGNAARAYSFDGVGNYIESSAINISGVSARTVSFWAKTNSSIPMGLVNWGGNGIAPQNGNRFSCVLNYEEQGVTIDGADCAITYAPNNSISSNQWNYYCFVMNEGATLNQVLIYQNGEVLTNVLHNYYENTNLNTLENTLLQFGRINYPPLNFNWFNGLLDDIAIYNRVLTEQEIQNLYTATNTGNTVDNGNGAAPLPQGIPYQAAARDANGQPVVDSPVNVRFSLHEGAADGATSYIESHSLTTNSIGLFNTVFGNGTPEQSAFDSINWAATTKFLQVEVDLGNGYVDMGTTQLLSVPYAFRSAQAATLKNAALPIYPDNAAALAGGLVAGEMYRTASGDLKIVY